MIKQLSLDVSKVFYQKKYSLIWMTLVLISVLLSFLLLQAGAPTELITDKVLTYLRPISWLLSCYLICDVISSDFHYNTLKIMLPYAKSRYCYLISKIIIASAVSFLGFLLPVISVGLVTIASSNNRLGMQIAGMTCLGAIGFLGAIVSFVSMFMFILIVTEHEIVTIGCLMGIILLLFVLESIETLSPYLPTMWGITFASQSFVFSPKIGISISVILLISWMSLFRAVKWFEKKDIFI